MWKILLIILNIQLLGFRLWKIINEILTSYAFYTNFKGTMKKCVHLEWVLLCSSKLQMDNK